MFENVKDILLSKGIVIENEYLDKYVDLLESRRFQLRVKYKTQKHHIIPRFIFDQLGETCDDSDNNLVNLFYSEHVLAHYYLAMCCKDSRNKVGNLCAVREVMYGQDSTSTERLLLDKLPELQQFYEEVKHINCLKPDTPQKISQTLTGTRFIQNPVTLEYRCCKGEILQQLLQEGWIFKHPPQSDESKFKCSIARTGKRTIYKGDQIKQIYESELDAYLSDGWVQGDPRLCGRKGSVEGKTPVTNGEVVKYVYPHEVSEYISRGYVVGNNRKGKPSGRKGVKFSETHKNNLAKARVGRVALHKGDEIRYVQPHEVPLLITEGWLTGTGRRNDVGTKGKVWITNGVSEKYIPECDLQDYVLTGEWKHGRISRKLKK